MKHRQAARYPAYDPQIAQPISSHVAPSSAYVGNHVSQPQSQALYDHSAYTSTHESASPWSAWSYLNPAIAVNGGVGVVDATVHQSAPSPFTRYDAVGQAGSATSYGNSAFSSYGPAVVASGYPGVQLQYNNYAAATTTSSAGALVSAPYSDYGYAVTPAQQYQPQAAYGNSSYDTVNYAVGAAPVQAAAYGVGSLVADVSPHLENIQADQQAPANSAKYDPKEPREKEPVADPFPSTGPDMNVYNGAQSCFQQPLSSHQVGGYYGDEIPSEPSLDSASTAMSSEKPDLVPQYQADPARHYPENMNEVMPCLELTGSDKQGYMEPVPPDVVLPTTSGPLHVALEDVQLEYSPRAESTDAIEWQDQQPSGGISFDSWGWGQKVAQVLAPEATQPVSPIAPEVAAQSLTNEVPFWGAAASVPQVSMLGPSSEFHSGLWKDEASTRDNNDANTMTIQRSSPPPSNVVTNEDFDIRHDPVVDNVNLDVYVPDPITENISYDATVADYVMEPGVTGQPVSSSVEFIRQTANTESPQAPFSMEETAVSDWGTNWAVGVEAEEIASNAMIDVAPVGIATAERESPFAENPLFQSNPYPPPVSISQPPARELHGVVNMAFDEANIDDFMDSHSHASHSFAERRRSSMDRIDEEEPLQQPEPPLPPVVPDTTGCLIAGNVTPVTVSNATTTIVETYASIDVVSPVVNDVAFGVLEIQSSVDHQIPQLTVQTPITAELMAQFELKSAENQLTVNTDQVAPLATVEGFSPGITPPICTSSPRKLEVDVPVTASAVPPKIPNPADMGNSDAESTISQISSVNPRDSPRKVQGSLGGSSAGMGGGGGEIRGPHSRWKDTEQKYSSTLQRLKREREKRAVVAQPIVNLLGGTAAAPRGATTGAEKPHSARSSVDAPDPVNVLLVPVPRHETGTRREPQFSPMLEIADLSANGMMNRKSTPKIAGFESPALPDVSVIPKSSRAIGSNVNHQNIQDRNGKSGGESMPPRKSDFDRSKNGPAVDEDREIDSRDERSLHRAESYIDRNSKRYDGRDSWDRRSGHSEPTDDFYERGDRRREKRRPSSRNSVHSAYEGRSHRSYDHEYRDRKDRPKSRASERDDQYSNDDGRTRVNRSKSADPNRFDKSEYDDEYHGRRSDCRRRESHDHGSNDNNNGLYSDEIEEYEDERRRSSHRADRYSNNHRNAGNRSARRHQQSDQNDKWNEQMEYMQRLFWQQNGRWPLSRDEIMAFWREQYYAQAKGAATQQQAALRLAAKQQHGAQSQVIGAPAAKDAADLQVAYLASRHHLYSGDERESATNSRLELESDRSFEQPSDILSDSISLPAGLASAVLKKDVGRAEPIPQRSNGSYRFASVHGLYKLPSLRQQGILELRYLRPFITNSRVLDDIQQLEDSPMPLVKGETHKNSVILFCQKKAISCAQDARLNDAESCVLVWRFFELLLRQNGNILGSDIAALLLSESSSVWCNADEQNDVIHDDEPTSDLHYDDDDYNSDEGRGYDHFRMNTGTQTVDRATHRFRELLFSGNKKEALELAIRQELWGHALFLANQIDQKTHITVMARFANSLDLMDPLQTLYQLMSRRQPHAVTHVQDMQWNDWRPHLAMIVSNLDTKQPVDAQSMFAMGNALVGCGRVWAGHFCFLAVHLLTWADVWTANATNRHIALVGIDAINLNGPCDATVPTDTISCTEIFEFCVSQLFGEQFCYPSLQVYKFLKATRLCDMGFKEEAYHYCRAIALAINTYSQYFSYAFVFQVYTLGSRLQFFDSNRHFADEAVHSLPAHLAQLEQLLQQLQRAPASAAVPPDSIGSNPPPTIDQTTFQASDRQGQPGLVLAESVSSSIAGANVPTSRPNSGDFEESSHAQASRRQSNDSVAYHQPSVSRSRSGSAVSSSVFNPATAATRFIHQEHTPADSYNSGRTASIGARSRQSSQTVADDYQAQQQGAAQRSPIHKYGNYDDQGQVPAVVPEEGYQEQHQHYYQQNQSSDIYTSYAASNQANANAAPVQFEAYTQPSYLQVSGQNSASATMSSPRGGMALSPGSDTVFEGSVSYPSPQVGSGASVEASSASLMSNTTWQSSSQYSNMTVRQDVTTAADDRVQSESASIGDSPDGRSTARKNAGNNGNKSLLGRAGNYLAGKIFKGPNQMILPKDENPTIIWDDVNKKWLNTAADAEEETVAAPPPSDIQLIQGPSMGAPDMMTQSAPAPSIPRANIGKTKNARSRYANAFGSMTMSSTGTSDLGPGQMTSSGFMPPPLPAVASTGGADSLPGVVEASGQPNYFIPAPVENTNTDATSSPFTTGTTEPTQGAEELQNEPSMQFYNPTSFSNSQSSTGNKKSSRLKYPK